MEKLNTQATPAEKLPLRLEVVTETQPTQEEVVLSREITQEVDNKFGHLREGF